MITSTVIKLIGFMALAIEFLFYWILTQIIGDIFYIADTIGFLSMVGTMVFMVVATVYAHASVAFCCWFWERINQLVSGETSE